MRQAQYVGRSQDLQRRLNSHLLKLTGICDDFYSRLSNSDLIELKTSLSDVNNLLTLKTTFAAANWICEKFSIPEEYRESCISKIDRSKPNSNGYDIHLDSPIKLVAEVKCTNPINNKNRYGAAQLKSILDDAVKLETGKAPVKDTSSYYKFLFLLDLGPRTEAAIASLISESNNAKNEDLSKQKSRHQIKRKLEVINSKIGFSDLNFDRIYIVPLSITSDSPVVLSSEPGEEANE